MKYKLYTTSQRAWSGMYKAMSIAEKSIYIEMYIFLGDTSSTHDFISLLKAKAISGVEVVVIADAYGSSELRSELVNELKEAGVEFMFFTHWFKRTHRKIVIIDNEVAFLGGVNIKETIRYWNDLQIQISGKIVKTLLKSFAYTYEMVGGQKQNILFYSRLPLKQKLKSWIIDNLTKKNSQFRLSDNYIKHIVESKKSIRIVTPYLMPPRRLLFALDRARKRGVEIEILIPRDTDIKILNKVNYLSARRLTSLGIRVYLSEEMNHAKILLLDNEEGLIGSQNIDILSFNFNMEAGVFFKQKHLVSDLNNIFNKWMTGSKLLSAGNYKLKLYDRFLIFFLKFFYPIF